IELWPAAGVDVTLAYGRGLRLPEAQALIPTTDFMAPSPTLSRSDSVEVGGRARLSEVVTVSAVLFGSWLGSELIYDHASAQLLDRGSTRRLGTELGVRLAPVPWAELRADVTLVQGRFAETDREI